MAHSEVESGILDLSQFLIEETPKMEARDAVLVNTNEAGTLFVTDSRLLFLKYSEVAALERSPARKLDLARCLPLGYEEIDDNPSQQSLQVIGTDTRVIVYLFGSGGNQDVYNTLTSARLARLSNLYAVPRSSESRPTSPKLRLLNEHCRIIGTSTRFTSSSSIQDLSFTASSEFWKISKINANYSITSYPFALLCPASVSDEDIEQACAFRARKRVPIISWCDRGTGAVLARSSQPLVGFTNRRSDADERLVNSMRTRFAGVEELERKLYIVDARPFLNAFANRGKGGGSEALANYSESELTFLGIGNIHDMRASFVRLRNYLDVHGSSSSKGDLRDGVRKWAGHPITSVPSSVSGLYESGWLKHVHMVLAGASWIARLIATEKASVLVHCSDGWDRTPQLVSLASLLLDPHYRTFVGFQALIEKDWLAFGHCFADRLGIPSSSGEPSTASSQAKDKSSPIFLQWVDCVSQLLRMYPFAFEFSSVFLVDLLDHVLSCQFGNFLCNSEREREQHGLYSVSTIPCMWDHLAELRSREGLSHPHHNVFYDPTEYGAGPILPPSSTLMPTLWPEFYLRWGCPSECKGRDIEAYVKRQRRA